tara:strand:+ start:1939 stop:2505 length:567 start_codon:yes stop_codon:yes gene_type:complete
MGITKQLSVIAVMAVAGMANANECLNQSVTTTQSEFTIKNKDNFEAKIAQTENGYMCVVNFTTNILGTDYEAEGVSESTTADPISVCKMAESDAEKNLIRRQGAKITYESKTICKEKSEYTLNPMSIGTIVDLEELRLQPNKQPFEYLGVRCVWFYNVEFRPEELYSHQGVACEVDKVNQKYQIVDKF